MNRSTIWLHPPNNGPKPPTNLTSQTRGLSPSGTGSGTYATAGTRKVRRSQNGFGSSLTRLGLLAKLSTMANRGGQPESLAELVVAGTTLRVVLADITKLEVDVIVNAANTSLLGGGGVDGAIHEAAGPALLDECHQIVDQQGGCDTGEAVITSAGELAASWVVHTVGPFWTGQDHELQDLQLTCCYQNSLMLANKNWATSIAFPNIGTGVYHFPKERAVAVALRAILAKVEAGTPIAEITFCCFDQENADLYVAALLGR